MRRSIQWRLVTIYFLLVWLAMSIIGVYITESEKTHQMNNMTSLLASKADGLALILKDKMTGSPDIGEEINLWYISQSDQVRAVLIFNNALIPIAQKGDVTAYYPINDELIKRALDGERVIDSDNYNDYKKGFKTVVMPITSTATNEIQGAVYIISDMSQVNDSLSNIKGILSTATLWALLITVLLGSLLARTITEPIKEVTKNAAKLAHGDFNQKIPVHSNDEIGQLTGMFNFMSDRLKDTLDEVYNEKSKLETILTHMTDGILAIAANGDILHTNPAALSFITFSEDDVKILGFDVIAGRLCFNFRTSDLFTEKIEEINDTLITIEDKILRINIVPYKNEKNEAAGAIMVIQDVTNQEKLDNMRKEFVANVSHELRTPLTTIKSYTETLLDGGLEDQSITKQFLKVIDSESDRMTRLVKDLLQISKIDYDKAKWNMSTVNPLEIANNCMNSLKVEALQKEQKITLEVKEPLAEEMMGDKDRIAQVIINIANNAIKYTPEKGEIKLTLSSDNTYMKIKVSDNGIGIPKEDLPRLFERFYRVDKARSRNMGGTGLGLAIAKQIVEAHKGNITIESEYGVGTTVTINLKLKL